MYFDLCLNHTFGTRWREPNLNTTTSQMVRVGLVWIKTIAQPTVMNQMLIYFSFNSSVGWFSNLFLIFFY